MSRSFVDSNVLVYAFSQDARRSVAARLLEQGPVISVQSLNEFASVARRKMRIPWPEVQDALAVIESFCPEILPLDVGLQHEAVRIAGRYDLAIYDAMIVAAALEGGCDVLYSEDMHHGLVIDRRLRIENPFRG